MGGTISLPTYISGGDVTIQNLQLTNTTLSDVINGGIDGDNISDGGITSSDLAESISPVTYFNDSFNDFTISGMLPATDAGLTSDISAGVSYVNGIRVTKSATSHTYTASKDTYVYINEGGYYIFSEVANGAAAPTTPSDSLLLAKAVTNGTAISSVSDLRTLSIQITATSSNFPSHYRREAYVSRDSTIGFHIEPGDIAIGSTIYSNASITTTKSISVAANWIESGPPALTVGKKFYMYAYNNSGTAYDLMFSSADPVYADTSENTGGTLRYYESGGVYYRAIGWAWVSADAVQEYNFSQFADIGIKNRVFRKYTETHVGSGVIVDDDTVITSSEGTNFMRLEFVPSNPKKQIHVKVLANIDSAGGAVLGGGLFLNTSASAMTAIRSVSDVSSGGPSALVLDHYMTAGVDDLMTFHFRAGATSGNMTLNGVGSTRRFAGTMGSYIVIEEEP